RKSLPPTPFWRRDRRCFQSPKRQRGAGAPSLTLGALKNLVEGESRGKATPSPPTPRPPRGEHPRSREQGTDTVFPQLSDHRNSRPGPRFGSSAHQAAPPPTKSATCSKKATAKHTA